MLNQAWCRIKSGNQLQENRLCPHNLKEGYHDSLVPLLLPNTFICRSSGNRPNIGRRLGSVKCGYTPGGGTYTEPNRTPEIPAPGQYKHGHAAQTKHH
jgi:hypothetical protein